MKTSRLKSEAGFGMTEVLVSMGIFLTIVLCSTTVSVYTRNNYWNEQKRLQAMNLAESLVEELLLRAKTDPALKEGEHSLHYDASGVPVANPDRFRVDWTITNDKPMTDTFELIVRVTWKDQEVPRSVMLQTARSFNP